MFKNKWLISLAVASALSSSGVIAGDGALGTVVGVDTTAYVDRGDGRFVRVKQGDSISDGDEFRVPDGHSIELDLDTCANAAAKHVKTQARFVVSARKDCGAVVMDSGAGSAGSGAIGAVEAPAAPVVTPPTVSAPPPPPPPAAPVVAAAKVAPAAAPAAGGSAIGTSYAWVPFAAVGAALLLDDDDDDGSPN